MNLIYAYILSTNLYTRMYDYIEIKPNICFYPIRDGMMQLLLANPEILQHFKI